MRNYPKVLAAIAEVKGSGFWSGATERRIKQIAKTLLAEGVSQETVADTIREFWSIGQVEYGE